MAIARKGGWTMEHCLSCDIATMKKCQRLLTNKGGGLKVLLILRHHYSVLLTQRKVRFVNGDITMAEINEESFIPEAYLCESC